MNRKSASIIYVILVVITAGTLGLSWYSGVSRGPLGIPGTGDRHLRNVDVDRIQLLIQEERLSDKEAQYQRRVTR